MEVFGRDKTRSMIESVEGRYRIELTSGIESASSLGCEHIILDHATFFDEGIFVDLIPQLPWKRSEKQARSPGGWDCDIR
jgi:hypothetical protein